MGNAAPSQAWEGRGRAGRLHRSPRWQVSRHVIRGDHPHFLPGPQTVSSRQAVVALPGVSFFEKSKAQRRKGGRAAPNAERRARKGRRRAAAGAAGRARCPVEERVAERNR